MSLSTATKKKLRKKLYLYEGNFNHLYLDTKGKVTIGVGHLIPNKGAISALTLYTTKNNLPDLPATLHDKQNEYDKISKLPWGQQHGAASFKPHTTLTMKTTDIHHLLDNHVNRFYKELTTIYKKTNGYVEDFDNMHENVQLALFDMIFNLGASKIVKMFKNFDAAIKVGNWKKAANESNRPDVNVARNQYVKQLLTTAPTTP